MSAALSTFLRVIRIGYDSIDAFNSLSDFYRYRHDEQQMVRIIHLANKVFILGCTTMEFHGELSGIPKETLLKIKKGEVGARALNIPLSLVKAFIDYPDHEAFSTGIVIPVASFLQSTTELNLYDPPNITKMSPDELAKIKIPVLEKDQNSTQGEYVIKGYRPLSNEEIANVKISEQKSRISYLTYEGLARLLNLIPNGPPQPLPANPQQAPAAGHAAQPVQAPPPPAEIDPFDLVRRDTIPNELHNDIVFSRYVCPITLCPIRYPLGDPNGKHIYESTAIFQQIELYHRSPMTNLPLTKEQLIPKPHITAFIEDRLKFHQVRLRQAAGQSNAAALNPQMNAAALQENPNL